MSRAEVAEILVKAGVKSSATANAPDALRVVDWGMELRFIDWGPDRDNQVLRQLSVEDEASTWDGQKIIGVPLHVALEVMQTAAQDTGWRPEDAVCEPTEDALPAEPGDFADEFLLSEGTLWLPKKSIGLVMVDGVVSDLVWRRAEDVPETFCGPVTPAQLELSRRTDLEDHLAHWLKERLRPAAPSRQRSAVELVLAVLLILALAYVGWKAWREMMGWEKAAHMPGRVMSIETKPGLLGQKLYKVEYTDSLSGHDQVVMLEPADFLDPPHEPGEAVMVCYQQSSPPHVGGSARMQRADFLSCLPWIGGILLAYGGVRLMRRNWVGKNGAAKR